MKKIIVLSIALITFCNLTKAQNGVIGNVISSASNYINGNGVSVSNDEIIKGLREALSVGTNNSSASASKADGFFKNSLIKIPFPPDVKKVDTELRALGMGTQCDKFVETLNRAAEKAAKDAAPIFLNAITSMSISDGLNILKGGDGAATSFLKNKTNADLKLKFFPVIKKALQDVQITKYWNPLMTKYNKIPFVQKVNPNLDDYVTGRALEGLFKLVAQEENKIRKDPASRISDLLKKVFG